jgi:hypothetical protein
VRDGGVEEELMFRKLFVLLGGVNNALGAFLDSSFELMT